MSLQRAGVDYPESPVLCSSLWGDIGAGGEEHEERGCITPVSRTFGLLATLVERFHAGASGNASSKPLSQGVSRSAPVAKTNPSAVSTGGGGLPLSCTPLGWGLTGSPEDASRWCLSGPDAGRCALNVPSLPASLPAVAGGRTRDWPPTRRAQSPRLAAVPRGPRLCPRKAFFPRTAPVADWVSQGPQRRSFPGELGPPDAGFATSPQPGRQCKAFLLFFTSGQTHLCRLVRQPFWPHLAPTPLSLPYVLPFIKSSYV